MWDLSKRIVVHTHRRENERFWYLAAHPRLNLFAAAHDTGLVLFKLARERPPFAVSSPLGASLLYVKDRFVRQAEPGQQRDAPLITLRSKGAPRDLLYSARDQALLVTASAGIQDDGSSTSTGGVGGNGGGTLRYELYAMPKPGTAPESVQPSTTGSALSVAWVKRQRFAALSALSSRQP